MKKILVFNSGYQHGGRDRLKQLIQVAKQSPIPAEIIGVVSNYENGAVQKIAEKIGLMFFHLPTDAETSDYQSVSVSSQADIFILIDWHLPLINMTPRSAFNQKPVIRLHPGPPNRFGNLGGAKMYREILAAFSRKEIKHCELNAHLLIEDGYRYLAHKDIIISTHDTRRSLEQKMKFQEIAWYEEILSLTLNGLAQKKLNSHTLAVV